MGAAGIGGRLAATLRERCGLVACGYPRARQSVNPSRHSSEGRPRPRRVRPVAVAPIQSSMALAVVLVKANCLPSGLQTGAPSFAPAGACDRNLGSVRQPLDGERRAVKRQVRAVGMDVDAQPSQTQHGLRHLGDRRVAQSAASESRNRAMDLRRSRRWRRVQNIQDLARRLLIGQRGGHQQGYSDTVRHIQPFYATVHIRYRQHSTLLSRDP